MGTSNFGIFLIVVFQQFIHFSDNAIVPIDGIYFETSKTLATISCRTRDPQITKIEWFVNNKKLVDRVIITNNITHSEFMSEVSFTFVDDSRLGNIYQCRTFNGKTLKESQTVKLQASPHITIQMDERSIYARPNQTVLLNCTAWGNPTPSPRWVGGRKPIYEHSIDLVNSFKNLLTAEIKNFNESNAGRYVCMANNSFKAVYKRVIVRLRGPKTLYIPASILVLVTCAVMLIAILSELVYSLRNRIKIK